MSGNSTVQRLLRHLKKAKLDKTDSNSMKQGTRSGPYQEETEEPMSPNKLSKQGRQVKSNPNLIVNGFEFTGPK